jgi:hypothetical protein
MNYLSSHNATIIGHQREFHSALHIHHFHITITVGAQNVRFPIAERWLKKDLFAFEIICSCLKTKIKHPVLD